jgi:hypothetical protein
MFDHDGYDIEDVYLNLARRLPGEVYAHVKEHYETEHSTDTKEDMLALFLCTNRFMFILMDSLNSINAEMIRMLAGDEALPQPPIPKEE